MNKLFNIEIFDFAIIITILGIKITSKALYNVIYRNPLYSNCSIPNLRELKKKNVQFPHPIGIVIAPEAEIGYNVIVMQNVTIGYDNGYPTIGNNVKIMPGAVVAGNIKIGDNAVIGANAVVRRDVDANALAVGVPATIKKYFNN